MTSRKASPLVAPPPGVSGDRLLVTVLLSRTLPLIRYELTDRVRLATEPCPCGRPFRLLAAVEGRTDQLLRLPDRDGTRRPVHPVVFTRPWSWSMLPAGRSARTRTG